MTFFFYDNLAYKLVPRNNQATGCEMKKENDDYYVNDDLFPNSTSVQAAHSSNHSTNNASVLMLLEKNMQLLTNYYFVYEHNLNCDSYSIPFLSCTGSRFRNKFYLWTRVRISPHYSTKHLWHRLVH